jgi:hypothetical protein
MKWTTHKSIVCLCVYACVYESVNACACVCVRVCENVSVWVYARVQGECVSMYVWKGKTFVQLNCT